MKTLKIFIGLILVIGLGCAEKSNVRKDVQTFLDNYNQDYKKYAYMWNEGEWALNTKIVEGDTITSKNAQDSQAHPD